ncbi:GMC family oxidoreductase [Mycolicibacterium sp.]|uniref:GMC family oxidoreductase n=1 Tax=Mycolicibacterium sp. TaxID=2320850 RepID=UPI003D0FE52B
MTVRSADYIVVGAGSAGSIVAARLADAGASVILVEAGGTDRRPDVRLPFGVASLFATANWRYPTAPDPSRAGADGPFAGGRIVGGSGSINAMVFVRGRPSDYDRWAEMGATGWDFAGVLPHFKALERWIAGPDDYRGGTGPIDVSWCGHRHILDDAFIDASVEAGHSHNPDQNGRTQLGVARCQVNQRRGLRCSSAHGYLHRVPRHQALQLFTRTQATRVLLEAGRAVGVECGNDVLRARQEVILCAGTIGSAALLLRSGIDRPGVGENFHDHLSVPQGWETSVPTVNTMGPVRAGRALASLVRTGTGALTTTPFEAQLFTLEHQIAITPVYYALDQRGRLKLPRVNAFTVYTVVLQPEARGRVRLRGDRPQVEFPRLSREHDVRRLLAGAALTREIVEGQPAMRALVGNRLDRDGDPTDPGWLTTRESSVFHAVGTCRMGVDDRAVVDPHLRVHGVDGLRVIDASVMPTITAGNTNAPTMMIAHRGAELVLQR